MTWKNPEQVRLEAVLSRNKEDGCDMETFA
jgi:hypothetical protein